MTTERTAWAVQLKAQDAARAMIEACKARGIDLLPVKGVITSRMYYADIAERPMMDVDFRVRADDLDAAIDVAKSIGRLVDRYRAYRSAIIEVRGMMMDLETSVGPPGMCDLSVDAMLSRAKRSTLLGFDHLLPDVHDHALLLAVNVFKDKLKLAQPAPMQDAMRVVRDPNFDPRLFAHRAKEAHAHTLAWIVAEYIHREHGEWRSVLDALGPPRRARYASWMSELERRQDKSPGSLSLRVLSRAVNDQPSARIHALFRMSEWGLERLAKGRVL